MAYYNMAPDILSSIIQGLVTGRQYQQEQEDRVGEKKRQQEQDALNKQNIESIIAARNAPPKPPNPFSQAISAANAGNYPLANQIMANSGIGGFSPTVTPGTGHPLLSAFGPNPMQAPSVSPGPLAFRERSSKPTDNIDVVLRAYSIGGPEAAQQVATALNTSFGSNLPKPLLQGRFDESQNLRENKFSYEKAQNLKKERRQAWYDAFKFRDKEAYYRFKILDLQLQSAKEGLNLIGVSTPDLPDPIQYQGDPNAVISLDTQDDIRFGKQLSRQVKPQNPSTIPSVNILPDVGFNPPSGVPPKYGNKSILNSDNQNPFTNVAEVARATKLLNDEGKRLTNEGKQITNAKKQAPKTVVPKRSPAAESVKLVNTQDNPEVTHAQALGFSTNAIYWAPAEVRANMRDFIKKGWIESWIDNEPNIKKIKVGGGIFGIGGKEKDIRRENINRRVALINKKYANKKRATDTVPTKTTNNPSRQEIIKAAKARGFTTSQIRDALKEAGY